ncbi:hypothetical protein BTR14_07490 [Rhizobium rhizosphaerae]|uniref:Glycosyltransferase n=1 Tax=Xaviernesmea rhizosphaerae TaxID=1672749 RepID=A0ABX3PGN5_9HYPH|nr:glycosyltransferase [Xaviernesmea rhizosphaerae]OQP87248.1 hypothetical protein BTR14_07490 [Xaviernesmea rhizosphaerae]
MPAEKTRSAKRIAVITPIFRHSGLVIEAIESIRSQSAVDEIVHVLVNDGCPFASTHETCATYATAYPEAILYLRKKNGGLSSARNFGIRHILATLPEIELFYFLDADNRLHPQTLERASAFLRKEGVDWVYPDVDMFGLREGWDYGGDFSGLLMRNMNLCEAGSLLHRRVFEAGVFFDETMRQGYEDWDFFISALEHGFRGKHLENFGFLYRKRPESMLADSTKVDAIIRQSMQRKHRAFFADKAIRAQEQREFPRYAIYLADEARTVYASDPYDLPEENADFVTDFWAAVIEPGRCSVPPFLVVTTAATLRVLQKQKLAGFLFWAVEEKLSHAPVAAARIDGNGILGHEEEKYAVCSESVETAQNAHLVMMSFDALLGTVQTKIEWLQGLVMGSGAEIPQLSTSLQTKDARAIGRTIAFDLLLIGEQLAASPYRETARTDWDWRKTLFRRVDAYRIDRKGWGGMATFPPSRRHGRNIGFLLPLVEFGGVEKVVLNMARTMKAEGWGVHLYITERTSGRLTGEWQAVFDNIIFLIDPTQAPWSGPESYFGTPLSAWNDHAQRERAVALMGWQDVVVNAHAASANWLMGALRQRKVVTVASLHLTDLTTTGRPVGHTFLTLAFEHAYDHIATCSQGLADWCRGMGMPAEKLVPVVNAPTFTPAPDVIEAALAARGRGERLRVLFLGRLDPQKGLDALAEIVSRTRAMNLPIDWTIVGKAVVSDSRNPAVDTLMPYLRPPVFDREALMALYRDHDVLVLPSQYEGLPLVLLEAMQLGVVALGNDVGAVREAIRDGETGFLLDPAGDVPAQAVAHLRRLARDRTLLRDMSAAAVAAMQDRSWAQAMAPLIQRIEAQLSDSIEPKSGTRFSEKSDAKTKT